MRNKKDEIEKEQEIESDGGKEEKKLKRREGVERRKSAKKRDKIARWSGFILFLVVVLLGFLLWIAGEIQSGY